jgi:hypothetical protein
MPKRRKTARARVLDKEIEKLREAIARGIPWRRMGDGRVFGHYDLYAMVRGLHYHSTCSLWKDKNDSETPALLWAELKREILAEHTNRRPGSRPWAWWKYDAPETRRAFGWQCHILEHGSDCQGILNHRPLPSDTPDMEWARNHFGRLSDDRIHESERDFLERLGLLTPNEKTLFARYGAIVFAHVSIGEFGKCEPCWQKARTIAKQIDFDLDAQLLPYDVFWLPESLMFDCEHEPHGSGIDGIFTEEWR